MSRFQIGAAVLMLPEHGGHEVETTDMTGRLQTAREIAGVAAADDMLLEVTHQRWDGGGQCFVSSRAESPPAYDRLVGRLRMGVRDIGDGTEFCELAIARWDDRNSFGSMRQATLADLDNALGGSATALLVEAGALEVGTRLEVLGDVGIRRNYLCARFPSETAEGQLTAFVITRVVPMLRQQRVTP